MGGGKYEGREFLVLHLAAGLSFGNVFAGMVEQYRFEPYASDSEEEGGSEDGGVKNMKTPVASELQLGRFCFSLN